MLNPTILPVKVIGPTSVCGTEPCDSNLTGDIVEELMNSNPSISLLSISALNEVISSFAKKAKFGSLCVHSYVNDVQRYNASMLS